jgi:hypothetical protein
LFGTIYSNIEVKKILEKPMKQDIDSTQTDSSIVKEKFYNTLTALMVFGFSFGLILLTIIVFHKLEIEPWWFLAMIVFEIVLIPSIWTYAISPGKISEQGALSSFDKILRNLNLFKFLIPDRN